MSNKGFMIILGGSVCAVIVYLSSIVQLLPSFLAPFVGVLYAVYVIYMVRQVAYGQLF